MVEAFFTAARTGNFDALLAVLDPDVVFRHDHMSVPAGVPGEIHGATALGRVDGMKTRETAILSTTDCEMVSDIATIVAAVGSAAIVTLLKSDVLFGLYAVGLAIGFFAYFAVGLRLYGIQEVRPWQTPLAPAPVAPATPVMPSDTIPTTFENAS